MKIIFWQNGVSPHQSFLIRELASRHEVILAALEVIREDRLKQGWEKPDTGNVKIVLLENKQIAFELLNKNSDAVHIFSGIATYNILKSVFRKLDNNSIVGVIVEAGSPLGWQRHFRKALYAIKKLRYNKKIDFIFAMGDLGVDWYSSVGFPKERIHKFQYFTELPDIERLKEREGVEHPRLLFIGQLIDRKNIQGLLEVLIRLKRIDWMLDIVGDGPLRKRLKKLVMENNLQDRIAFRGNMSNLAAMDLLSNSDYLILPSNFDGWGAVINEALSRGVKVITNENCGASCMVKEMDWGAVYKNNSENRLEITLKNELQNFSIQSLEIRKEVARKFAADYSKNVVDNFEELLLSK